MFFCVEYSMILSSSGSRIGICPHCSFSAYLTSALFTYHPNKPPLIGFPALRLLRCVMSVFVSLALLFILIYSVGFLGCRSGDSVVGDDAVRTTSIVVAAAPFELSLEFTHFLSVGMRRTRMDKG